MVEVEYEEIKCKYGKQVCETIRTESIKVILFFYLSILQRCYLCKIDSHVVSRMQLEIQNMVDNQGLHL